ncbi:hypothetical protein E2320_014267 [Naja naja]|nr:hypothetical protein E2320_014267 [Naja naja]
MEGVYLDEKGDLAANLDIINSVISSNKTIIRMTLGHLERHNFTINQNIIAQMEMMSKSYIGPMEYGVDSPCSSLAPEDKKTAVPKLILSPKNDIEIIYFLLELFHAFLQTPQFYNHSIDGVYFDENGEPAVDLDIVNWIVYNNKSVTRMKSGHLERQGVQDSKLVINQNNIAQMEKMNKDPN